MNKAIFLDRDGTINFDTGYINKVEDLEFIDYAILGLERMQSLGYQLIIVTNQAGIAKGKFTEEDYFAFRNEMHRRLKEKRVIISAEYFCPHHIEGTIEKYKIDCDCRKPKTGMLERAAKEKNLDLKKCWVIGDTSSDILAGKNAGCRTIQVLTGNQRNLLGGVIRGADLAGSLEGQVLEHMRQAALARGVVHVARIDKGGVAEDRRLRPLADNQRQPVGQHFGGDSSARNSSGPAPARLPAAIAASISAQTPFQNQGKILLCIRSPCPLSEGRKSVPRTLPS